MAALDLVTLAEFKAFLPLTGPGADAAARLAITDASCRIEGVTGRRLVYRAPPETGAAAVLSATSWAAATPAVTNQPSADGRTLIVNFTTATAGTLTVVGTVAGASKTVVFDAANGLVQHGVDFFTAIASLAIAGAPAGGGTVTVTTSLGYVEYHSMPARARELRALERPFQQVLEVNEDTTCVYGAGTRLVENTDYLVSRGSAHLLRMATNLSWNWRIGWRVVKGVWSAGYFGSANVPADIKGETLRVAALLFQEAQQRRIGISGASDATGNFTRFGAARVPKETLDTLWSGGHVNVELSSTGERDFDLEAA